MHLLLKFCYKTWAARHLRYFTFRVYVYLDRQTDSKKTMMRTE